MTRDEIMSMDEDALRLAVAKALGWKTDFYDGFGEVYIDPNHGINCERFCTPSGLPDWPRDIKAAFELVDEMRKAGYPVSVSTYPEGWCGVTVFHDDFWLTAKYSSSADTAPMAICRAWLMRKEGA